MFLRGFWDFCTNPGRVFLRFDAPARALLLRETAFQAPDGLI
jgi:hypothetical protein